MQIEDIAKVCHEANRAFCEALGDTSQKPWEDAPDWQRKSAVNGVIFHRENPHARPSASHENWMAEKDDDGWVYGEVKDVEAKTHPCMVSFGELPVEQQRKDYLFKFICDALLPMVGASESAEGAADTAETFDVAPIGWQCGGPEYDALMANLPEGSEVCPYLVYEGEHAQMLHLRPANTTSREGFFQIVYDGWLVANLPSGKSYIVGFEVDYADHRRSGRPATESVRCGQEAACKALREHFASGVGDDALQVMERMGYLPRAGTIARRITQNAEGATA